MSRKLASIEKILKIEPIEGADNIILLSVLGWKVIVRKEENYKVGDLAVYIEYDTVLPEKPEFEFLRSCCYSKRYNGFRIKNRKLRGVFSEGIIFKIAAVKALDILPAQKIKEGLEVANLIGIRKYDPDEYRSVDKKVMSPIAKYLMRYKWFRKLRLKRRPRYSYPENIDKANESNIQVKFAKLKATDDEYTSYYLSEKLEGQASVFAIEKGKFKVYSHNMGRPKSNNNWWNIAVKFDIETKMREFMKLHNIKSMYIGGEIIGPGIQRNIYKLNDLDFYIFTIKNLDNGELFSLESMKIFCDITELKLVPIISAYEKLYSTSDEILEKADGKSLLNKNTKREGVVWRKNNSTTKDSFKAKGKDYQNWWLRKDVTE